MLNIKDPDTPVLVRSIGKMKEKQWVGMASVAFANSTFCLRVEFMKYLDNKSGGPRSELIAPSLRVS